MKNLSCFYVSYSHIGEDYSSCVDRIFVEEIKAALDGKRGKGSLEFLDGNGRWDMDFRAEKRSIEDVGIAVDVIFDESPLNTATSIEYGVLTLFWTDPALFLAATPDKTAYKADGCETVVFPYCAYLQHRNNDTAYFLTLQPNGKTVRRTEIFHSDSFESAKSKMDPEVYEKAYAYAKNKIESVSEFFVGGLFPDPWPPELCALHDALGEDSKQAAYFLSGIAQTVVLNSPDIWVVSKSKFPNRPFATLFFSKTEKKK